MCKDILNTAPALPAAARPVLRGLRLILLLLAGWQWGGAAWISTKAVLAQWLWADAWAATLETQASAVKPWPWADTWPVARLQASEQDVDLFVLAGAQGNSLAFGPGHLYGTALPGDGFSAIGGVRDAHFGFLRDLATGDQIKIQTHSGSWVIYQISSTEVVDSSRQPLTINAQQRGLVLVTCYPFDAINAGGPLRYLVWADQVPSRTYSM